MRLLAADPDVETLVTRINAGDMDLQPNFQRGEVWGRAKKQRLIDSILRDWHVPPIHVIDNPGTKKQEVLDGQQRLTAIRDFVNGKFAVDGNVEPLDANIQALHGKHYGELSPEWKKHFNRFAIRTFRLVDYGASEPAELFFRLNQPTNLTSAEQRNAFFGPIRRQVKGLVEELSRLGLSAESLGFSNFRMAYDDVIARVALTIERKNLGEKLTAKDLEDLYRRDLPLSDETLKLINDSIGQIIDANREVHVPLRFNKASLFTWSLFLVRGNMNRFAPASTDQFIEFLRSFQDVRKSTAHSRQISGYADWMFSIYENRSSFRVGDVSSVVLRDAALWGLFAQYLPGYRHSQNQLTSKLLALETSIEKNLESGVLNDELLVRDLTEIEWQRLES